MLEPDNQGVNSPNDSLRIASVHNDPELVSRILDFLYQYEDFCMYLIGNLEKFGPTSTDYPHSGNFYFIHTPDSIFGVFCLCNTGVFLAYILNNILTSDLIRIILTQIESEKVPISGIIAEHSIADKFISALRAKFSQQLIVLSNSTSELLKISDLHHRNFEFCIENNDEDEIRCLRIEDFSRFSELIFEFEKAIRYQHEPQEMLRKIFEEAAGIGQIWGYFKGNELVSMARLNSTTRTGGCFGGIYTRPEFRNRGLAKNLIKKALKDCKEIHSHTHNSLYTDESNIPALSLYNSLGFIKIGQMQTIFFTISPSN